MADRLTKDGCIALLQRKKEELGEPPKKSDMEEHEVAMIKSYFGPWPRALEQAGIKQISEGRIHRIELKEQKRIRQKQSRRDYKLSHNNNT